MSRAGAIVGVVASVCSIAGFVLALLLAPGFASWLYPLPLIVLLATALASSWTYFLWSRRGLRAADQRRLDQLVEILPRHAIRRIGSEDFAALWRRELTAPVYRYLEEFRGDLEHRFEDRRLERLRESLDAAADEFTLVEAQNGFPEWRAGRDLRSVGIPSGEDDERRSRLYETRRRKIHVAAGQLVDAYDALVAAAQRRRYDLSRLEESRHAD